MRPCLCCKTLVTQRWAVQERTRSPLQPHHRYDNSAARHTIKSELLRAICTAEPAISSTSLLNYTDHETAIRQAANATLTNNTVTQLCYNCAQPAILEARHHHSDTPPTTTESRLADYRAIFKGKPTALCLEDNNDEETVATYDPWHRYLWRGKLILDTETRHLGMIVTIAPSGTPTADPQQTPIVAFVRNCGSIDKNAGRGPALTVLDDITKCYELPLPHLDPQHSAYLQSPQAQAWQRRANLPYYKQMQTPPTHHRPKTHQTRPNANPHQLPLTNYRNDSASDTRSDTWNQ